MLRRVLLAKIREECAVCRVDKGVLVERLAGDDAGVWQVGGVVDIRARGAEEAQAGYQPDQGNLDCGRNCRTGHLAHAGAWAAAESMAVRPERVCAGAQTPA